MQANRSVLLGAVAAALLAGCGSAASSPAGNTTVTRPAPATSSVSASVPGAASATASATQAVKLGPNDTLTCAIAPASVVSADLATSLSAPFQSLLGGAVSCIYNGAAADTSLLVEYDSSAENMASDKQAILAQGQVVGNVAGLGDEAFSGTYAVQGVPTEYTLDARRGDLEIDLSSSASVAHEKTLVAYVFSEISP